MDTKLSFSQLAEAFAPYQQLESASFVQGMLVGQMSSTPSLTEAQWIKRLIDEGGIGAIKESFLMMLHLMYTETLSGLNSAECDLELLLPEDNESVVVRAKHLADWCEGFLYGMGLGSLGELSPEVSELLRDFGDISMVELPEVTDDDVADVEADLMELTEFVRMGCLMIYEELNPLPGQPIDVPDQTLGQKSGQKPTLH